MTSHLPSYHGYRIPPDVISHAVGLSWRCRASPDLLATLGVWKTAGQRPVMPSFRQLDSACTRISASQIY